jgi:hypothetical protein
MTPTIREIVEAWYKHVTALDQSWESWRVLGVDVEAPFPNAAWCMSTAYTESIEMVLDQVWGVDGDWLSWFYFECPKDGGNVKVDGQSRFIVTLGDLIEFLNSIANPGAR